MLSRLNSYFPSVFSIDAIASHGALHGSWLTLKRVARCHPFHRGGFDPVP